MQIIELMDGSSISVKRVFGGPRIVDGVKRDVLRIEFDDSVEDQVIEKTFKNNKNAFKLYTYSDTPTENGGTSSNKILMGTGYTIYLGIKVEEKTIPHKPGLLLPDIKETIKTVELAQITYEEYQESIGEEV